MTPEVLAVYVILDPDHCAGRPVEDVARLAIEGGATFLQLRAERRTTFGQMQMAERLQLLASARGVPLLVNDRVDVALAVGAAGVHVGHPDLEDMPPEIARRLLGPDAIVGVSVATPEEAVATASRGASYLSVGPIFGTGSKGDAGPAVGPGRLRAVKAACALPLCAIGGITVTNANQAVAARADGVAVISAVCAAADPRLATRQLVEAVGEALARR